ncbi:MAG: putative (di)nucleoside polyphosphate hydrolase [Candidatus Deianiraeaceae bacterium]|jgi:putative (di)nucleoside polyphosphate hydrolase
MYLINKKQDHLYRPNVGCVLMKNNKIFVAKRIGHRTDTWQMPQGGVNSEEEYEDALLRELKEEIGTNNIEVIKQSSYYRYYKIPKNMSLQMWGGKYIGQKQRWFLANFKGEDAEINIDTAIPEFEAWKWLDVDSTINKAVFFKKDIYIDVLAEFNI